MTKVFLSAGHGGSDAGAIANGLYEKTVNLNTLLACKAELERHGVTVVCSRSKDENDPVSEEVIEANASGADIAVSFHANAGGGDGFEAFYFDSSAKGKKLAGLCEKHIKALLSLASADDLANAGNQHIHSGNRLAVVVESHIEGLDLLGIINNEYGTAVHLLGQVSLVLGLQIAAPGYGILEVCARLGQQLNSLGVGHLCIIRVAKRGESVEKALVNKGIEECKLALLKKTKGKLDANFIEGMACVGGCIGGAGCLTHHSEKNRIEADFSNIIASDWQPDPMACYKPVIYLYPEEEMQVSVKLALSGGLTCTYPAYENGWQSPTEH